MDINDFDKLSMKIVELVLTSLPMPTLCKMQCVCKTWYLIETTKLSLNFMFNNETKTQSLAMDNSLV